MVSRPHASQENEDDWSSWSSPVVGETKNSVVSDNNGEGHGGGEKGETGKQSRVPATGLV